MRTAKIKRGYHLFLKTCFWRHPTYLAWEVPLFSQNEPIFALNNGFTWETNPDRCNVPGTYVESPAHADDLVERFPGAVACLFRGGKSAPHAPLFSQNLTFPAAGPANFSGDGLRCTPRRRGPPSAVPRHAGSRASAGRGKQGPAAREGEGVLRGTFSRDKPSLYSLFIDSKRLSEQNAP